MRLPPSRALLVALSALALAACGGGAPDDGQLHCSRDRDCPAGQGCAQGVCQPLPCGGCQADEVCTTAGLCVAAQGAACPSAGCPRGYVCNANHVCGRPCTLNGDCDAGTVCNSQTATCAQCVFDSDCKTVAGKPRCDGNSGVCVECTQPLDCTQKLGAGHFCDADTHTCKAGCKLDGDCNLNTGETCDLSAGTPGRCVQCKSDTDCSVSAPACDPTGHCVICTADKYCGPGTPRCNTQTKTCVSCLPADDATGADCGCGLVAASGGGFTCSQTAPGKDPHNASVCDPGPLSCVQGCSSDANCGCPRDPSGKELDCARRPGANTSGGLNVGAEHCDPAKTQWNGQPSRGACVECTANTHCRHRVIGATDYNGLLANLDGARCVSNSCVEGCDADADCPASNTCDTTTHKCVQCSCRGKVTVDGYCEDPAVAGKASGCGLNRSGAQLVCDATTDATDPSFGKCRNKREAETCTTSAECGDTLDPTVGQCVPVPSICVFSSHGLTGASTWCSADHLKGRCGIGCSSLDQNQCASGIACPPNTACRSATGEAASTQQPSCVPVAGTSACNKP